MGSLVAELAEKLSAATNSLDFDEQTMFLNTSANTVGIGTNAPASKLDVRGTMQVGANTDGNDVKFFGTSSGKYWLWDESDDSVRISGHQYHTGMIIVGVNDTGHDVKFFGASALAFMEWDESADELEIRGPVATPGKLLLSTAEPSVVDGNKLGQIDFQAPVDTAGTDAILVGASIYAEADATFSSSVNSTELVFATGASETATEKVRITSDGKVGIGSAAPTALLNVSGTCALGSGADVSGGHVAIKSDGTGTDGAFFVANSGGTTLMKILDNGKVGIGTSAPDMPLHLATATVNVGQIIQGSYDNNANPNLTIRKSNGSIASPTAITSGHYVGQIRFNSYDGNSWHDSADIVCATSGTVADGRVAGELRFRTAPDSAANVSERMRIDSSGRVGIGTTTPSGFTPSLTVYGTQPAISAQINSTNYWQTHVDSGSVTTFFDDDAYWRIGTASNSGNTSFSEKMRIRHDGKVWINTTSDAGAWFSVGGTSAISYAAYFSAASGSNTNHAMKISRGGGNHQGSGLYMSGANYTTGDNAYIQIHAGGYSGSGLIYIKCHDDSGSDFYVRGDGYIYASGSFNASDERLKKNIVSMKSNSDDGLKAINQLNPVRFDWKNPDKGSNKMGLIAQEVEPIIPEAVGWSDGNEYYTQADVDAANTDGDGNPIKGGGLSDGAKIGDLKHESQWGDKGKASVDYQHIQTHLIKAIQDLSAKVTALENA